MKKRFTVRLVWNGLFFIVLAVFFISTSAKALLIQGLMKVGLFQPEISSSVKQSLIPDNTISFQDPQGKIINLSSLRGKVVFINFWATWCPPCVAELPSINQLHQELNADKHIVFLLADADGDFSRSLPFMAKLDYHLPVYKLINTVPKNVWSGTMPTTVVINKQGKMVFHHEGAADYSNSKFINYLHKLAAE